MTKSLTLISVLATIAMSCSMLKTSKLMKQGEIEQKHFKVEVPFEMKLGLIMFPAKVNGKEYDFILDTGAPNVLTKGVVKELNLTPSVNTKASDSQGKKGDLGLFTIENIEIGGLNFKNTAAAEVDFSISPTLTCFNAAGLIGANLMRTAIWQFDFENKVITIASSRDSINIPESATIIGFEPVSSGTPKLNLSIGSIKDERVTLDLGSNGGYTTTEETYNKLNKQTEVTSTTKALGSASSGIFGTGDGHEYLTQVSSFSLGSLTFDNQHISFRTANQKLLGVEFFRNFNLTIDWFTNEIILVPVSEEIKLAYNGFGFAPEFKDNKLIINYLLDSENVKNSGLEIGDQLIRIEDKHVENIALEEFCSFLEYLKSVKEKNEVSIEVRKVNGEKTSLVIKKIVL